MIQRRPCDKLATEQRGAVTVRHHFPWDAPGAGNLRQDGSWGALDTWDDAVLAPHARLELMPDHDEQITYLKRGGLTHWQGRREAHLDPGELQVLHAAPGARREAINLELGGTELFHIRIHGAHARARAPDTDHAAKWGVGQMVVLASENAGLGGAALEVDATLLGARLMRGQRVDHHLGRHRMGYLVAIGGTARVNGVLIHPGDGCAICNEGNLEIEARTTCEFVLADVACC